MVRLRALIHLAVACAVVGLALAVGRWLRDPEPGGSLVAILAVATVIALCARRLYRAGGLGRTPPATASPTPAPDPVAPAPPPPVPATPPPLWMRRERFRPPVTASGDLRATLQLLNRAGVSELQTLPGVGRVTAEHIVDERERGGPFGSVDDLARVGGLGPARIRALSARVRT